MNKTKKNTIIVIITVLTLLIFTINITTRMKISNKVEFTPYTKYKAAISIIIDKQNKERIDINFKDDGNSIKIRSNLNDDETFIIGDILYYKDNNVVYKHKLNNSYRKLNSILSDIKNADVLNSTSSYTFYSVLLNKNTINRILDAIFFNIKTEQSSVGKITAKNNQIETFSLVLTDIKDYKKIDIVINFEKLSDNYKIDTSKILGNKEPIFFTQTLETTDKNILEIIK